VAAYILVNVKVHDPDRYEHYKSIVGPTVAAFGGRYLVRGGPVEIHEGTPKPERVVVLEFPDAERARAWWSSAEYAPGKRIRQEAASSELILVQGV
jgi:uncharacterized protein (DUF1330 family)